MKLVPLDSKISGPVIIETEVFRDSRGFFAERFNRKFYEANGLPIEFAQDNQSRSLPQVLRGLHFQHKPPQGKLIWVAQGKIFDVVVDLRRHSPTFLRSLCLTLDGDRPEQTLWVPPDFAHGFCVLGDRPADVVYKMTSSYNPKGEGGLMWNDKSLKINWPIENPILSERDQNLLSVEEYKRKYCP